MSVTTIKQAVKSIQSLPEKKRVAVSGWVVKQVAKDTVHSRIKNAVESGSFNALVVEGLREYADGTCLKCLHP